MTKNQNFFCGPFLVGPRTFPLEIITIAKIMKHILYSYIKLDLISDFQYDRNILNVFPRSLQHAEKYLYHIDK